MLLPREQDWRRMLLLEVVLVVDAIPCIGRNVESTHGSCLELE